MSKMTGQQSTICFAFITHWAPTTMMFAIYKMTVDSSQVIVDHLTDGVSGVCGRSVP